MEFSIAFLGILGRSAFLGVEVALAGVARQKLSRFGSLEALGERLVGFHRHKALHTTYFLNHVKLYEIISMKGHRIEKQTEEQAKNLIFSFIRYNLTVVYY